MGAAIHAASLISSDQEAFLLDVTPLSLRIGVAGDMAESVIERNTPVPIEQTRTFTTFQDNQESVQIRVYQGESRVADENELLGQFEFSGFRKARRGEVAIDVTFEINADGIVNVTARDQETGKQSSTSITLSSGLSEGELKSIIEEARTERVQTAKSPRAQRGAQRAEARAQSTSAAAGAAARAPAARRRAPPQPPAAQRAALERKGAEAARQDGPRRRRPPRAPKRVAAPAQPSRSPAEAVACRSPSSTSPSPSSRAARPRPSSRPTRRPPTSIASSRRSRERDSDLAPDPVDDSLDLLGDDDLAALAPEIDLVDAERRRRRATPRTGSSTRRGPTSRRFRIRMRARRADACRTSPPPRSRRSRGSSTSSTTTS